MAEALAPLTLLALSSLACNLEGAAENRFYGGLMGAPHSVIESYSVRQLFGKQIEQGAGRNYADEKEARKGYLQLIIGVSPIVLGASVGAAFPEAGYLCGGVGITSLFSCLMAKGRKLKEG